MFGEEQLGASGFELNAFSAAHNFRAAESSAGRREAVLSLHHQLPGLAAVINDFDPQARFTPVLLASGIVSHIRIS